MARLSVVIYQLPCTKRARPYFPSGLRTGLMVRIENAQGQACQAEYAPLSGIHRHNSHQTKIALEALSPYELAEIMALDPSLDLQDLAIFFTKRWSYPLSFILSCAYFHLHLPCFISQPCVVKLSGLVLGELGEAQNYLHSGYSCLKLKVGAVAMHEEVEKILAISALMGPAMSLRMDANQCLSLKKAQELLSSLKQVAIQYFEEPLENPADLPCLYEQSGIDLALDESFTESTSWAELRATRAKYLIFKPSRFSSLFWVMHRCRQALEHGMTPILSTCFESDWSVAINALLAGIVAPHQAHGIAAEGIFHKSLKSALPMTQGQISTADALSFLKLA